jgi:hypothetical protein
VTEVTRAKDPSASKSLAFAAVRPDNREHGGQEATEATIEFEDDEKQRS